MAKKSGGLNSPMEHAIITDVSQSGKAGDTMDRNPCPYFSDPHSMGKDTIPEVFETGVNGKGYHGKIEGATTLNSPMQGMKTPSDPRK
jgi:hypothetical protein